MKAIIGSVDISIAIGKLQEHATYLVDVKCSPNNVEHKAILFTGFKTGGYRQVYTNSYEAPIKTSEIHSIKILKFLTKLK